MKFSTSVFLFFFLFNSSCEDNFNYKLKYEGETGQPEDISLNSLTPEVNFHLDINPGDGIFILDTGSPMNVFDKGHYDSETGEKYIDSSGLGLFFPELRWICDDIFEDSFKISGLIGGDVFTNFNWILDYGSENFTLLPKNSNLQRENSEVTIPFELKGGGIYQLSNNEKVKVGATRHIFKINVEGLSVKALLDTGASYVVLSQSAYNKLDNTDRPQYGTTEVVTVTGKINAPLTEFSSIDFEKSYISVSQHNIKGVIVPDSFLKPLEDETGVKIKMLLGGSFLSNFRLRFDEKAHKVYVKVINKKQKYSSLIPKSVHIYKPVYNNIENK